MTALWYRTALTGAFISALSIGLAPAHAACVFCDKVVKLDSRLAFCFQKEETYLLKSFKMSKRKFMAINLGVCTKTKKRDRSIVTGTNATRPALLKSNFILDQDSLTCLLGVIKSNKNGFDPRLVVDLRKTCD